MSPESLLARFGYIALVIGLLFEGETILVIAAFLARRGYLQLQYVVLIGFLVTFLSDQFFFWMGRTHGHNFLASRPRWKQSVEKARKLLGWNANLLFIGFRFMYGLRTVMPFVFGMSGYSPKRFALLNSLGALLWVMFFGITGYMFGKVVELVLADVQKYELWIVLAGVLAGGGFWVYRRIANWREAGEIE